MSGKNTRSNSNNLETISPLDLNGALQKLRSEIKNDMNETIDELKNLVISQNEQITTLKEIISAQQKEIDEIKKQYLKREDMENHIQKMENKCMEENIDEYMERKEKRENIVVFGLKESNKPTINEKIEDDLKAIEKIKKDIGCEGTGEILKVFRIGKKSERPRPIVVKCDSRNTWRDILTNSKKLREIAIFENVHIQPQLTKKQLLAEKELKNELRMRKEKGEKNLSIKNGKIIRRD